MNTLKQLNSRMQTKALYAAVRISSKLRDKKGVSQIVEVLGLCAVAVVLIAILLKTSGVTIQEAADLVKQKILGLFNYT